MSQITETGIAELIEIYTKTYIDNPSMMLSGYGQENQTVADYNGRQLLELMQNADDAKSNIIRIQLDTANHTLSIANNGTAFSLEGIESLMYTGLSTKNKTEYIGNKGLGFRSILNWVHQVSILTREVSVRFSKAYSENYFDKNIANNPTVKKRIDKEIAVKKLSTGEKPIAALAFPEIITDREKDHTTKIVLDYKKEELKYIKRQIKAISEEILLFLPNIRSIIIEKDGKQSVALTKTVDKAQQIVINGQQWNIHRSTKKLYDAKTKFKYAIAWKDQPENKGLFHNYFPTDVATGLPCIIHATFDLTNNRKQINDTAQNHFILTKIATALGHIAAKQLKSDSPDWQCYRFLTPDEHNSQKITTPFFKQIKSIRDSMACYPALDGNYVTKEEAIYHGPAFSDWVEQHGFGHYFPGLLKTPLSDIRLPGSGFNQYTKAELIEICKKISSQIKSHNSRAGLIKIFTSSNFDNIHSDPGYFPLLISTDYQYKEGTYCETVFALNIENRSFSFPEELKISFIKPEFHQALLRIFKDQIEQAREASEDRSRTLKRILKNVVDLGSNDITDVLRHIVSETNKILKSESESKTVVIKMIHAMFSVFDPEKNAGHKTTVNNIPLLNRKGEIQKSDELFFGNDYLPDTHTESLFDGIYTAADYLLSAEKLGFAENDKDILPSFFEWLGVNRWLSVSKNEDITGIDLYGYYDFLFTKKRLTKPDHAEKHNSTLSAIKINNIEALKKIPLYKLLVLLEKSTDLKREINLSIENNSAKLFYKYGNAYPKQISVPYSYIYYQISKIVDFTHYTVSDDTELEILFQKIDFSDSIFLSNNIDPEALQHTLKYLGTSESVKDTTETRLFEILEQQDQKFPNGNKSRGFYQKCMEYYLLPGKEKGLFNKNIPYFAKKGTNDGQLELKDKQEVYYSDNVLLPHILLQQFYFINLPKRIGEDNVKEVFGIQLIKDELKNIKISTPKEQSIHKEFSNEINRLKPYFLTYRLEGIRQSQKAEAQLIKPLQICLVSELTYSFKDVASQQLKNNEFIPVNGIYYLKTDLYVSLSELRSDSLFCDAIAEIICMTFKVSSQKNIFRRIFKDGVKESLHILKSDEKEDTLDKAKKLLGISQEEIHFWQEIFPGKITETDNEDDFTATLTANIGKPLPEYYKNIDFSQLGNKNGITFLKWLSKDISLTLEKLIPANTLNSWHKEQLDNCIRDYTGRFEQLLWSKCNTSTDRKEKENFLTNRNLFDRASENIVAVFSKKNSLILEPDYHGKLCAWTKEQFLLDLQSGSDQKVEVKTKYRHLLKNYSFGNGTVDDMENILKKEKPALHSLMYFEGFEEEIKAECEAQQAALKEELYDQQDSEENLLPVAEAQISKAAASANKQDTKHGSGSYNSKGDRKKAASGKKQEHRVKRSLQNQGYLINPVYEKTDAKHYDLEYKKEGEAEWRFLEVKKDSGGYFFLSKAEKETALAEKNAHKYDLAIVSDTGIRIIKSPFLLEDETFENNSKFRTEPTEYKISFKINEE